VSPGHVFHPPLRPVGMAFVVVAPGAELHADELIEWARGAMANYGMERFYWRPRDERSSLSVPISMALHAPPSV